MAVKQPARRNGSVGYRPDRAARLWRHRAGRDFGLAVLAAAGLLAGGCSYQLGSMVGPDEDGKAATTGSLGRRGIPMATPVRREATENHQAEANALPGEADLAVARTAIAEALGKTGTTASASWENPATGARGTVTPLTAAYKDDGRTCRDFLASHVRDGHETWLEGGACRVAPGRWEVKRLKPWKRA